MKAQELRELSPDELTAQIDELKRKLFNLRFQRATGEMDNTAELLKTRKDVARALTVAREKQREAGE